MICQSCKLNISNDIDYKFNLERIELTICLGVCVRKSRDKYYLLYRFDNKTTRVCHC